MIDVADGGQPVGDDDHGHLPFQGINAGLDVPLRLGVQGTGGFVQDQ